jgi:hypothetical protein
MTIYRVSFFKDALSSDGHPFKWRSRPFQSRYDDRILGRYKIPELWVALSLAFRSHRHFVPATEPTHAPQQITRFIGRRRQTPQERQLIHCQPKIGASRD